MEILQSELACSSNFICGITGGSGSGKTTLANLVFQSIGADKSILIHQDNYYKDQSHLPLKIRHTLNYDHPDAFDNDLFSQQIQNLRQGRAVEQPIYDFTSHTRTKQTITVEAASIIILDGILLFHDDVLRHLIDLKIYVDMDRGLCLSRRMERDVLERGRTKESAVSQYLNTVKPMHAKFVEPQKEHADMIISGNGDLEISVKVVLSRIKEMTL